MIDDFEDRLRAMQPADPPADLLRRLRHAEPALPGPGGEFAGWLLRWRRALLAGGAAALLAYTLVYHVRPFGGGPGGSRIARHPENRPVLKDLHPEDDNGDFAGTVALNIRLGASPDLIPVSLRPDYDPRPRGALNFRVDWSILNDNTTN